MKIIDRIAKNLAIRATNIPRILNGNIKIIDDDRKEALEQIINSLVELKEIWGE